MFNTTAFICHHWNRTDLFYFFNDMEALTKTSEELLRIGVYHNLTIIDSDGHTFFCNGAEKAGWTKPFWGYKPFIKGRGIRVKLDIVASPKDISIQDLKNLMVEKISNNKRWWESAWDVPGLMNRIKECNTFKELITLAK